MNIFSIGGMADRRGDVLEWLRENARLDEAAISRAELVASRNGQPVEQVLNQLGALTDRELAQAYGEISGCALWDPSKTPPALDPSEFELLPGYLRSNRMLPLARDGQTVICAVCDPFDDQALAGLAFSVGGQVRILVAQADHFRSAIDRVLSATLTPVTTLDERRLERELDQVSDFGDEGDGVRVVANAFDSAISLGASDIHFEPRRNDFRIRLRIDGRLTEHAVVSADLAAAAVSRVKVIANLNLGEHRLPQDGRTTIVVGGRQIDVRVATAPTAFGESAVLRILDRESVPLDLEKLGFQPNETALFQRAAALPHGLCLITGPTGSGKTTTLYAVLQTLATSSRKVLSVEDPIEYHFEHVSQTQVQPGIGLTFASALRAFLRLDPDVILVGEIRDHETAAVAIQAAMTGHLVLASVHANDALAVIPRLLDLGVEPFQLAAGFRCSGAQRLVRRLCVDCRAQSRPDDEDRSLYAALGVETPAMVWRGTGCASCNGEGFKGRAAIAEGFMASPALLRAIAERKPIEEIEALAAEAGYLRMIQDGAAKVLEGLTTPAEVLAAVNA